MHVPCEAGCALHPGFDAAPAYVSSQADKGEQPTFCWVRTAAAEVDEQAACDAAAPMLQRLCACAKLAVQAVVLEPQGQTTAQQ